MPFSKAFKRPPCLVDLNTAAPWPRRPALDTNVSAVLLMKPTVFLQIQRLQLGWKVLLHKRLARLPHQLPPVRSACRASQSPARPLPGCALLFEKCQNREHERRRVAHQQRAQQSAWQGALLRLVARLQQGRVAQPQMPPLRRRCELTNAIFAICLLL